MNDNDSDIQAFNLVACSLSSVSGSSMYSSTTSHLYLSTIFSILFMFLFNISTEHKVFIKKIQKPVFGISARYDSTLSYFILITTTDRVKLKRCTN
jgi:hypothetical protein